ncbi:MAG: DHA2 family efflux MFS transporter permease subunit, partial [Myxococcales bacterium]|nr:DHA2 family efflux MFS transporter permease subunit [Myxococcales bacterium]
MTQSAALDPSYRWKVLGVVMVGTVMSALDASIVNVALPNIMASFGANVDQIEWVVTGYMLGFSTFMPLTAWLRERIGYRSLYMGSLAVFTLGSVLCGLAPNLTTLVIARVIQAFGGGAVTPTGMALIAEVFPPKERGRALGYWGVGVILGPAIGPTLGGYLTEIFGWRSIFNINLPVGMIALAASARVLQREEGGSRQGRPFDLPGFLLLSSFLVTALLALSNGNHEGWTSRYVIVCAVVSAISFALFMAVESVVGEGILDLGLFKNTQFS